MKRTRLSGKRDRALYLRDSTVEYWREVRRRAKVLSDRPSEVTADDLLLRAFRLLNRQIESEAARRGVDLRPPKPGPDSDDTTEGPEFRQVPRPPVY